MNQAEWLRRTAEARGEAPALMLGEAVVADYAGFARRAAAFAGFLGAAGSRPATGWRS